MLTPVRLRKILRDLWSSKTRTILIVLTIAIGAFAVGTIARTWIILSRELDQAYLDANPASIILSTDRAFHEDLVKAIEKMPAVAAAQGRYRLDAQVQTGPDDWRSLQLTALGDFQDQRIDKIKTVSGAWPPPEDGLLLERSSQTLVLGGPASGEPTPITIEVTDRRQRTLTLTGLTFDVVKFPTQFSGLPYGYISQATLTRLTGEQGYNQLIVVAATDRYNVDHLQAVADLVSDKVTASGFLVVQKQIPTPGVHPLNNVIQPALYLLAAFSFLSILLSAVLILNTMSEIMLRQVRIIGIMKSIGAWRRDLLLIYLGLVLTFGLLALCMSVPLSTLAARGFAWFIAGQLNFDIGSYRLPTWIYGLDLLLGVILPPLVAWFPVSRGIEVTVSQALSFTGAIAATKAYGELQWLSRLDGLPLPMRYALRNVFRHKLRLALTLLTLTLAGANFVIVLTIQAALGNTIEMVAGYWQQDITLYIGNIRMQVAKQAAMRVPGVLYAEGERLGTTSTRILADDQESSTRIVLFGVLPDSRFLRPTLIAGRWLRPEDQNAIVINVDLTSAEPDLGVGDELRLMIRGREAVWQVVGIVTSQVIGGGGLMDPTAYVNYPQLARLMRTTGHTNRLLIDITDPSEQGQTTVGRALKKAFRDDGLHIGLVELNSQIRNGLGNVFGILISLLLVITVLLALAGGLGLMGTVSHSVLERTREFAIIRSLGGSGANVAQLVIAEGLLIGLISWVISVLVAVPGSRLLSDQVGQLFLKVPLTYLFPVNAIFLWLGAVLLLSTLASLLPARRAAQLTVSEALAYE